MVLTLTTTQDCNLGCYYCYETRSNDSLQSGHLAEIVAGSRSDCALGERQHSRGLVRG